MKEYRLFFSWQSDRKDTKKIIRKALDKAKKELESQDIELYIDQDTRDRVGKKDIKQEVLQKIDNCDIYVADLTPVTTIKPQEGSHDLPKHLPNSNVMFEYGYALRAKGESHMIVLASIDKEIDEHIEYMPFDINHDTITVFSDVESLKNIKNWILNIISSVEKERESQIPDFKCSCLFLLHEETKNFETSEAITIKPLFKKVWHKGYKTIRNNKFDPFSQQNPTLVKPITSSTNYSFYPINLIFNNDGQKPLDNISLSLNASNKNVSFQENNTEFNYRLILPKNKTSLFVNNFGISRHIDTLNPGQSIILQPFYLHAPYDIGNFELYWSINSRNYKFEGTLHIRVEPKFEYDTVYDNDHANSEIIEDCIKFE